MLLESYTTLKGDNLMSNMPDFLNLGPEVTGDSAFSMFNLSLKEEWVNSSRFCHKLSEDDNENGLDSQCPIRQEAQERLDANRWVQSQRVDASAPSNFDGRQILILKVKFLTSCVQCLMPDVNF